MSEHHKHVCHVHKYKTIGQTLFKNTKQADKSCSQTCDGERALLVNTCTTHGVYFGGGNEDEHHNLRQLSTLSYFTQRKSFYGQGQKTRTGHLKCIFGLQNRVSPNDILIQLLSDSTNTDSVCCVSCIGNTFLLPEQSAWSWRKRSS